MNDEKSTGHTQHLRNVLKAARKERKLSTQDVADLIAAHIGAEKMSGETVRQYEIMEVNPPIDKFAAWARVLGHRLVVNLDRDPSDKHSVMLRSVEAVEIAKLVDAMTASRRKRLLAYLLDEDKADNAE